MTTKPLPSQSVAPARLSRRAFLRAATSAAAGMALSACLPHPSNGVTQTASGVQIVYQDWNTPWFPPMAQQMLGQFNTEHPDVQVFYVPDPDNVEEQLIVDMRAGNAPDVFQSCCTTFPIVGQAGYALDLRPYVARDIDQATIDDWDPAQYRALFLPDGTQFGLPKYHGALALYYNKDAFDAFGVDYPDGTWDHGDYLDAMKLLTHDLDGDGQVDQWGSMCDISWDRIQMHVNGWGGHFVDPADAHRSLMAAPEALDAMEWLRARMWDDHVMATPLDVNNLATRDAFVAQKIAMVEDGSWALKDILSGAPFRVGVAPFPAGPARHVTLATTDGFGIYAGTHHPDAAWELMKFLIGPDYGRAMARAHLLQPARASLVADWIGYILDEFPGLVSADDVAAFAEGHLKGYSVVAEIFANMVNVKEMVYAAWEQIFVLGQSPVDRMVDVSRQVEAVQQQG